MRVFGKSGSDSSKYIIEVSEAELSVIKSITNKSKEQKADAADIFKASQLPSDIGFGYQSDNPQKFGYSDAEDDVEIREVTTDEVLDQYNAKIITKELMTIKMNAILGVR